MLKVLQARLQQYMNWELPDVQDGFRKGRGNRSNCQHLLKHRKKERTSENIYFCFIDCAKAFVLITTNYGKFLKRWEYQTIILASWETYMQIRKQQLGPDMEQWTGSKFGKEYIKAVCCHPAYFIYIQNTSCKMPGWMNHKLGSRL